MCIVLKKIQFMLGVFCKCRHLTFRLGVDFSLPMNYLKLTTFAMLTFLFKRLVRHLKKISYVSLVYLVGLVPTRVSVRNLINGHNVCT